MKKLTTAKIWQFAAGQFGWALLSGIISNWLVYFYQPDETAISQGQTVFIPQGLVIFGVFTIIGGITAFGRIFDAFTDPMIASWSDRCTSKNGRRIPFVKGCFLIPCVPSERKMDGMESLSISLVCQTVFPLSIAAFSSIVIFSTNFCCFITVFHPTFILIQHSFFSYIL